MHFLRSAPSAWNQTTDPRYHAAMPKAVEGHVERLPSGSYRISVFAGWYPVTRRRLYLRSTVKTEPEV